MLYRITRVTCSCRRRLPLATLSSNFNNRSYYASPPTKFTTQIKGDEDGRSSQLGLHFHLPPDSNSEPEPNNGSQISDQDWEIRTGRAIYVLQQTLPEFFHTGLIISTDKATGAPKPSSMVIPVINANPLDFQVYQDNDVESIYSPKIGLSYTPPVALPAPFPTTLHVEGLPLYMASSVFVRHTLNALYSDLSLALTKVVVKTPDSTSSSTKHDDTNGRSPIKRRSREKSLLLGFRVAGTSRVSKGHGEWEVYSTYTFSPKTGLINRHTVNSIYPAPHQAVYDSLRMSLGKVLGLGLGEGRGAGANGTTCTAGSRVSSGKEQNH